MSKKERPVGVYTSKEFHTIQYDFPPEELQRKGKMLSVALADLTSLEKEKKEVASSFSTKIEGKQGEINILADHIGKGYEMKKMECTVEKDFDAGVKRIFFNNELKDTQPLSQADFQIDITQEHQNETTTVVVEDVDSVVVTEEKGPKMLASGAEVVEEIKEEGGPETIEPTT